jgi:hypothetical protein
MNDDVVQIQTWNNTNWFTIESGLPNLPAVYVPALRQVVRITGRRARVVDSDGRLLDLLAP